MIQFSSGDSLYSRIGGDEAIRATVARLYDKILSDDRLIHFFEGVDVERLRRSQHGFVAAAFGAPRSYHGKALGDAHRRLVKMGLNDTHFDAVAEHLKSAMQELNVTDELISEALNIVGSVRDHVLNRLNPREANHAGS